MPQTDRNEYWPLPIVRGRGALDSKDAPQQMPKDWNNFDHKLFTTYLALNNIKDHLLKSRFILKTSNISSVARQITCVTTDQVINLATSLVIRWAVVTTIFGKTLMAVLEHSLCAVFFIETYSLATALERLQKQWPNIKIQHDQDAILPFVLNFKNSLIGDSNHTMPIILNGTEFQLTIWRKLLQIPYGLVISYGDLASFVENKKACRAVGTAVGENPIAYLIPCHRVINSSGAICQYHWGSEKKRTILAIERTIYRH